MSQKDFGNEKKESSIHYDLSVSLSDLNLPKFLSVSAAVYVAENLIYYPFDVIRTRLQVERDQKGYAWGKSMQMAKQLGWRGCYTGFVSSTIGYLPSHAIYFLSYNWSKDVLQKFHDKHIKTSSVEGKQSMWVSFVAGGFADLTATFFIVPMEVVVQRLQIQDPHSKTKYKGGIDAIQTIYKTEGWKGFFRGSGATLLAYAPASAVWWATYEQSKAVLSKLMTPEKKGETIYVEQHPLAQIIAGAIAGWATVITTNPLDVVKTRLQTQHHQLTYEKDLHIYSNTWGALKHMWQQEGWKSFSRGIGPKLLTTTFFSSWFGICYEFILEICRKTPHPIHPTNHSNLPPISPPST